MNAAQTSTRKKLISNVASLITGSKAVDPKARRKQPFPGTPETYRAKGGFEKRLPPEHVATYSPFRKKGRGRGARVHSPFGPDGPWVGDR